MTKYRIKCHALLQRTLPLFGFLLILALPSPARAEGLMSRNWVPAEGDVFIVDVSTNIGYLVHTEGEALPFPVATGRKSFVHYIGRYYRAETPIRTWTAEQRQIKGDRRTFGPTGRFIRLFRDGESSPYGIHSYYREEQWMSAEGRYYSMGCILVTEQMMDVIEKTFEANGRKMLVITTEDAHAILAKMADTLAMR